MQNNENEAQILGLISQLSVSLLFVPPIYGLSYQTKGVYFISASLLYSVKKQFLKQTSVIWTNVVSTALDISYKTRISIFCFYG